MKNLLLKITNIILRFKKLYKKIIGNKMGFNENYNNYKENHDLITKFFTSLSLLKEEVIFSRCTIDTNHTCNGKESNTRWTCHFD